MVNDEIQAEVVLVISETGEQLGKLDLAEALRIADERGFDLVCVAPNAPVPVCRLMDYSKFRYEQIKKAKEAKKNQKIVQVKEVRLSPTIDSHDFETKQRNAKKFLTDGDKVKVSCRFRGRMIEQANNTKELFFKFASGLEEVAQIDQQPYLDGRNMFMMLSPKTQKKKN
ncbi:MAG: translation initiation factor IF-3 [Bacilli bacterium]|nr:translation initiation factor IF-3 [Bacilli bacterium]MDY4052429.1 translation initiation factor IF-3 [Bacilli bacterium]